MKRQFFLFMLFTFGLWFIPIRGTGSEVPKYSANQKNLNQSMQQSIHNVVLITFAIPSHSITKGEVFFVKDVWINYAGGDVLLSARQDGTGQIAVDDKITVHITHSDGTTSTFAHRFDGGCVRITPESPFNIAPYLRPGINQIHVEFQDVCGDKAGASSFWLVTGGNTIPYFLSGKIRHRDGTPVQDVAISAGREGSTTTDTNGVYTLTLSPRDGYRLIPYKEGYSFSPSQRTVDVSGAISGVDFVGIPDGGPPTPFLDLPFNYGDSVTAFVNALDDTYAGGRVDSWFDHSYPDYGKNGRLVLYDGKTRTKNSYNPKLGCYESRCYDGHNGFDFIYIDPEPTVPNKQPLPIRPAASGVVTETVAACTNTCRYGSCSECGVYGNYVIVDHQNGYFTRYAHLKAVYVNQGQLVTINDTLGVMGATGNVAGRDGTHLHFSVYRDNGNGRWDGERLDKPVDPYGWKPRDTLDPWVLAGGPISHYLWKYPLSETPSITGTQGAVVTNTTGTEQYIVPPGAFSGQAIFEISPAPVAESSAQLRTTGHSFWLRLLEWIPGAGGAPRVPAKPRTATLQASTQFTLTKPITITVQYTDTDVLHLDVSQLTLYRWDEDQQHWHPLPTTVDPLRRTVTAQTWELGEFDLQAPLLCPTHVLEPDDGYAAAQWVWPNDWPLQRGLDIPQDRDWVRFEAMQGVTYTVRTQHLAGGADTVLNLYDVDAWTLLATNDDARSGPGSELVWRAPYSGTFFVEVVPASGSATNCSATYDLVIETIPGDVVADCRVDGADIEAVSERWRLHAANPDPDGDATTPNYETRFDVNRDGTINVLDVLQVAAKWGKRCP